MRKQRRQQLVDRVDPELGFVEEDGKQHKKHQDKLACRGYVHAPAIDDVAAEQIGAEHRTGHVMCIVLRIRIAAAEIIGDHPDEHIRQQQPLHRAEANLLELVLEQDEKNREDRGRHEVVVGQQGNVYPENKRQEQEEWNPDAQEGGLQALLPEHQDSQQHRNEDAVFSHLPVALLYPLGAQQLDLQSQV